MPLPLRSEAIQKSLHTNCFFTDNCLDTAECVQHNAGTVCWPICGLAGSVERRLSAMGKLSTIKVQKLREPGRYGDGDGLWLQISEGGGKSWSFRFMLNRKARQMGLGPLALVSLAEAREKAWQARRQLLEGADPLEAKRAKRAGNQAARARVMTFRQCAEAFLRSQEAGWRNEKHRWQWSQTLRAHCYPVFGDLDVAEVDRALVMRAVEPIWITMPETGSRLRGRIERVLNWAAARELRNGDNPAKWKGGLDALLPARGKVATVKHHVAMDWRVVPAFMTELRAVQSISARALEFTILTAARTIETIGARWPEFEGDLWTVPGSRMKAGKEHRVPLSNAAVTVLAGLPRIAGNSFAFVGARPGKGMSNMTMIKQLRAMWPGGQLTVHGFRSAFRDWAGEATSHPREVCEQALAHQVGNQVEQAYRRGDALAKRQLLMRDWADYCADQRSSK
jgi:integrase